MKSLPLFFFLICTSGTAQPFPYKKLKDIKIQADIQRISVDRLGGFYTVSNCTIEKFSPEGKLEKKSSISECTRIALLEAWALMRIYGYDKQKQQFLIFDHQLELVDNLAIDPAFAVEPQLATPSPDLKSYWILDIDNSLKKIDLKSQTVVLESDELKGTTQQFAFMREYQSFLFLLDPESGIYIINRLGKLISKIEAKDLSYFSFSGEDLYYQKDNLLHFYDIFSKDSYSIELPTNTKFIVATDERLIIFRPNQAEIFEFSPRK
jgi:hypothetical protein